MQRTDSLEKTLMPGKTEDRRRRGWQRMRWLDDITDLMDMSLSSRSWWRTGNLACRSPWGCKELDMTELNWTEVSGRQSHAQTNFSQCWEVRRFLTRSRIKHKSGSIDVLEVKCPGLCLRAHLRLKWKETDWSVSYQGSLASWHGGQAVQLWYPFDPRSLMQFAEPWKKNHCLWISPREPVQDPNRVASVTQ